MRIWGLFFVCSWVLKQIQGITSNRISFCLGLQGPSFTIDAQGAAALAALTNGAMSLRLQTDLYKPNHTALVGGVYLMLAGVTWLLLSAKGHLSHQGRCLTFDQSADGYAKSEGVANLVPWFCFR